MTITLSIDRRRIDSDYHDHYLDPQQVLEDINHRYPATAPDGFDPDCIGERLDEEDSLP